MCKIVYVLKRSCWFFFYIKVKKVYRGFIFLSILFLDIRNCEYLFFFVDYNWKNIVLLCVLLDVCYVIDRLIDR